MRSAVITAPFTVEIQDRPTPECGRGEVRVRVLQVGICGSDLQVYHGQHAFMSYPVIQGHEGVGVVDAVGDGVTHVEPGDLVAMQPQFFCGECFACRHGRINVCESLRFLGVTRDGLFTQYISLPAWHVVKLPKNLPVDTAMLIEPLAVGVNAARTGAVGEGDRVVVLGAGTIGNFTAQAAMALGAEVLITDIQEEKLALARSHGIHHACNTAQRDLGEVIKECLRGETPRVIFDCVAVPAVFEQAIACSSNAAEIVIVGNYKQPVTLEVPKLQRREIALKSVMAYNREQFLEAIDLICAGSIAVDGMISARYPLEQLVDAYTYVDEHPASCMRVAVKTE